MSKLKIGLYVGAAIVVLGILSQAFTWVDAGEVVVIQSPIDGNLRVVTEPGPTWQGWGKVTSYNRRQQVTFLCDEGKRDRAGMCLKNDTSIQVRFNDGGHANVGGIVSWEMPLAPEAVIKLHKEFGSVQAIDTQLVQPAIVKAFYLTGPLMSSTESYASRRTEFLQMFEDQLRYGVYKTKSVQVKEPDPITGEEKTVTKVELQMDNKGVPMRAEDSAFKIYQITVVPATIKAIDYDPEVEAQIKQQRDSILKVQVAQADAKKAEQDAITSQQQGMAAAAKARAVQEAVKATAVTQAEQQRDVAKLEKESAEFNKQKNILDGEGEAAKRQLIMNADGALDKKIAAYVQVNQMYATAIAQHQGSWVPSIVMGGNGSTNSAQNGASQLIDMLSAKAAKDLSLDLAIPNKR